MNMKVANYNRSFIRLVLVLPIVFLHNNLLAAQDSLSITLKVKDAKIEDVLLEVEKQSGVIFYYSRSSLNSDERISLDLFRSTLDNALNTIFVNKNVSWKRKGRYISISKRRNEASYLKELYNMTYDTATRVTVRGRITDELGRPLAGATVAVKGGLVASISDSSGRFLLKEVVSNSILSISSIGYETQEIKVKGNQDISVVLNQRITELKNIEIVSTGYQNISRQRTTGSFVKIDNELLKRVVSTDIMDRIYDVTSGLNYQPNTSYPRSPITIRGISTIEGDLKPLIVIDGFPYSDFNIINSINPNDIESITVLKDAAAASIWGARAGNGVIVMSTKKGRINQKPKIQLNSSINIGQRPHLDYLPLMNAMDAIEAERIRFDRGDYNIYDDSYPSFDYFPALPVVAELLLAVRREELQPEDAEEKIALLSKLDVRKDIRRYFMQNSVNQQYAVNISGGTERMSYFGSFGFDNNRGNAVGDRFKRYTLRLDNTYRPVKGLEVNTFLTYSQSESASGVVNYNRLIPNGLTSVSPYADLVDQQGNSLAIPYNYRQPYVDTARYPALVDWSYEPFEELKSNDIKNSMFDIRTGLSVLYTIVPGLKGTASYQYSRTAFTNRSEYGELSFYTRNMINQYMYGDASNTYYPIPMGAIVDNSNSEQRSWNLRTQLNFDKRWGRHSVSAILGTETSEVDFSQTNYRWYGYDIYNHSFKNVMDYMTNYVIRASGGVSMSVLNFDQYSGTVTRTRSLYANGMYTYDDRYIFTLSGRRDGANLFGVKANDKFSPFWSVGIGWSISNEEFYTLEGIPFLKLRISYGYNGNIKNGATVLPVISTGSNSTLTGLPQADLSSAGNPQLRWEKVRILNAGIDFGTRNNRIQGSLEYYLKDGLDLISNISNDPTSGVSMYSGNQASIKGSGFDFTLSSKNVDRKFKWNTDFILSYNKEKVTAFNVKPTAITLFQAAPYIGRPLYSLYSYRWAGLDPENGDPRGYVNGEIVSYDKVFGSSSGQENTKPEDIVYNGPINPTFFGALRNTLSYVNISISFNIKYEFGHYFRKNSIDYFGLFLNGGGHSDYTKRWQKKGDEQFTNIPSFPIFADFYRDLFYSRAEVLVEKADHIRLKDVRISYDINDKVIKRFPFLNLQLYAYIDNISLLWTRNREGIDPDYGNYAIPPARSYALGLNFNF